jgi:hypothetical protein
MKLKYVNTQRSAKGLETHFSVSLSGLICAHRTPTARAISG